MKKILISLVILSLLVVCVLALGSITTKAIWSGKGGTIETLDGIVVDEITDPEINFAGYVKHREYIPSDSEDYWGIGKIYIKGKISSYLGIPFSVKVYLKNIDVCSSLEEETVSCSGKGKVGETDVDIELKIQEKTFNGITMRVGDLTASVDETEIVKVEDIPITEFTFKSV